MFNELSPKLEGEEKVLLRKAGASIKKNVIKYLHYSGIESRLKGEPRNYDGTRPYVHIKDDVLYVVKKNKLGNYYVSIKGGKYTGYKWLPLNDGHIARDGKTFVPGLRFMERALQASERDIETIIHDAMKKVVE